MITLIAQNINSQNDRGAFSRVSAAWTAAAKLPATGLLRLGRRVPLPNDALLNRGKSQRVLTIVVVRDEKGEISLVFLDF